MKLVYEGSTSPEWATENHITESFRALGHDVTLISPAHCSTADLARTVDQVEPELFLLTRPWGQPPLVTEKLLNRWRARGIVTAGFHLDKFWGLPEREEWIARREEPLFLCDHLFSTDGDHDAQWAEAGIVHHWLPPGVLASECYDAEPDRVRWPQDVAFVGSAPTRRGGAYHPEHAHRRELVAWLEETYGDRFVHVGNGGSEPTQRGHALNVLYASVPVIVGDSCLVTREGHYWSDRVPETWGRGGFLIHPQVDALEALIGRYPSWNVGNWDELQDEIEGWLHDAFARDGTRGRIARDVRGSMTYTKRACSMLETLGFDCHRLAA